MTAMTCSFWLHRAKSATLRPKRLLSAQPSLSPGGKRHLCQHHAFRQSCLQQEVHPLLARSHDGAAVQPQRCTGLAVRCMASMASNRSNAPIRNRKVQVGVDTLQGAVS